METNKQIWKTAIFLTATLLLAGTACAQRESPAHGRENERDTPSSTRRFIHRMAIEEHAGYIFPTNAFLRGENESRKRMESSYDAHLKYSFRLRPHTPADRVYAGAYQGIGLGRFDFGNQEELGNPIALYLFQGGRIARFSPHLSFRYEWNLGVSSGWKSYHPVKNRNEKMMGSGTNAYLNLNFYLNWALSPLFDLTTGIGGSHFSNGNTRYPNAGLNTADLRIGLICNFNRRADEWAKSPRRAAVPAFPGHVSYDLTLFGSWRKKAVNIPEGQIAAPGTYPVFGFNFAPMYNFGYRFRAGISLDGAYDASANITSKGIGEGYHFPSDDKQLSLGLSARGELAMPYFTVGIGFGGNILHGEGDLKSFYQILALKIDVSRHSYLHVGYTLRNLHDPSYLMLGMGYRFHDKRPKLF